MKRCDFRGQTFTQRELIDALPRAEVSVDDAAHIVEPMLAGVRERGAAYLRELSEKFDSVRPHHLRVPANALTSALKTLDPMVRAGLEEAITRVRAVHKAQRPHDFTVEVAAGASVRQRWIPVARVGLYVPGGLAVYPSSVIMNVVAAQEAGVQSLAVASPPQARHGGLPHPTILAACELLGVSEVYAVGGAGAIGMFAYGAAGSEPQDGEWLCEPVNVITGPGNVFVAAAKRLVRGHVGIDAEAGPTEIAILADDTASVEHVVADLISQAEHDPQAGSVLVTMSESLADQVAQSIGDVAGRTKHAERVVEALSGPQSAIVLVDDLDQGVAVVDAYGAEHLEIQTADASRVADRITNAGAIFVGPYSPVSLGDYMAGSNHVLPTGGCAAFTSGLGVHSFVRAVQVIEYTRDALAELEGRIVALADAEDLPAHGEAVTARFDQ
ncbi:histidinol dehydrogenase [Jonesia denitrificans DSM 20603]|uniref:Histidinol dehydrogenase n=2 Tax=Jonesia TaxID=43673 RepID=C7R3K9_JONDD|nr:histidinol dehydrogenase [Jonesia denitrificans DSM 20603]SQH20734.1 Histidinol dehydrogenase [Jonesia denitrificans]